MSFNGFKIAATKLTCRTRYHLLNKMKKIFTSILAVIYLTFGAGATLHLHYCMGEFEGSSLFHDTNNKCGKCGMEKHDQSDKDCCKDIVIKSDDAQLSTHFDYHLEILCVTQRELSHRFIFYIPEIREPFADIKGPLLQPVSLFLWNNNFRI